MYHIFDVANWFLNKEPMSHKKLQKLCYYTQAWSYALKNRPFVDSEFQAWVHGPVSPRLYAKYAGRGFEDITPESSCLISFSNEDKELLESIWETYGEYTGNALEVLTHNEPPWRIARGSCVVSERCDETINKDDMIKYYRSIYEGDLGTEA